MKSASLRINHILCSCADPLAKPLMYFIFLRKNKQVQDKWKVLPSILITSCVPVQIPLRNHSPLVDKIDEPQLLPGSSPQRGRWLALLSRSVVLWSAGEEINQFNGSMLAWCFCNVSYSNIVVTWWSLSKPYCRLLSSTSCMLPRLTAFPRPPTWGGNTPSSLEEMDKSAEWLRYTGHWWTSTNTSALRE